MPVRAMVCWHPKWNSPVSGICNPAELFIVRSLANITRACCLVGFSMMVVSPILRARITTRRLSRLFVGWRGGYADPAGQHTTGQQPVHLNSRASVPPRAPSPCRALDCSMGVLMPTTTLPPNARTHPMLSLDGVTTVRQPSSVRAETRDCWTLRRRTRQGSSCRTWPS